MSQIDTNELLAWLNESIAVAKRREERAKLDGSKKVELMHRAYGFALEHVKRKLETDTESS